MHPNACSSWVIDDPRSRVCRANDDGVFLSCEEGVRISVVDCEVVRSDSGCPCECDGLALVDFRLKMSAWDTWNRMRIWLTGVEIWKGVCSLASTRGCETAKDAIARVNRVVKNMARTKYVRLVRAMMCRGIGGVENEDLDRPDKFSIKKRWTGSAASRAYILRWIGVTDVEI